MTWDSLIADTQNALEAGQWEQANELASRLAVVALAMFDDPTLSVDVQLYRGMQLDGLGQLFIDAANQGEGGYG